MTKEGKKVKEKYQQEIKNQYKEKILTGNCEMVVDLFFKDKKRRDIDNFNKLLLDSLEGIIIVDDKQIQKLTITKNYSRKNPRIEIKINEN